MNKCLSFLSFLWASPIKTTVETHKERLESDCD